MQAKRSAVPGLRGLDSTKALDPSAEMGMARWVDNRRKSEAASWLLLLLRILDETPLFYLSHLNMVLLLAMGFYKNVKKYISNKNRKTIQTHRKILYKKRRNKGGQTLKRGMKTPP